MPGEGGGPAAPNKSREWPLARKDPGEHSGHAPARGEGGRLSSPAQGAASRVAKSSFYSRTVSTAGGRKLTTGLWAQRGPRPALQEKQLPQGTPGPSQRRPQPHIPHDHDREGWMGPGRLALQGASSSDTAPPWGRRTIRERAGVGDLAEAQRPQLPPGRQLSQPALASAGANNDQGRGHTGSVALLGEAELEGPGWGEARCGPSSVCRRPGQ